MSNSRQLIARLEEDLEVRTKPSRGSRTLSSTNDGLAELLSDQNQATSIVALSGSSGQRFDVTLSVTNAVRSSSGNSSHTVGGDSSSMVSVLQGQRDRYKDRLDQVCD